MEQQQANFMPLMVVIVVSVGALLYQNQKLAERAPASAPAAAAPTLAPVAPMPMAAPAPSGEPTPGDLFNEAMMAHETGNPVAPALVSRALEAYQAIDTPSTDDLFHIASLQLAMGKHRAARATSERVLTVHEGHLLGLGTAAAAADGLNDRVAASAYYRRLLDAYAAEAGRALPEYQDHSRMLPRYRETAERYLTR